MTFRPMTFRLKLQQDEATIIHECGNTVRIDNRDIVRLLRNATEYGKLDPDDQQCLMGMLYDAMAGLRPMTVHAD